MYVNNRSMKCIINFHTKSLSSLNHMLRKIPRINSIRSVFCGQNSTFNVAKLPVYNNDDFNYIISKIHKYNMRYTKTTRIFHKELAAKLCHAN